MLNVRAVKTRVFNPGEDLLKFVVSEIPEVPERSILAVTSKIVSLAENRLISPKEINKETLVRREADQFLGEGGFGCFLTVKEGLLIPSAGIDESNSVRDEFILYPEDPLESSRKLWEGLRAAWGVRELGILMTDSHTTPLRRGVTGVCLSYWGFRAVKNMVGTSDLFGRELKMTQMNLADGLAAATVMMMGEGSERQPLALVYGAEVEFCDVSDPSELKIPMTEDLYYPMLKSLVEDPD